MKVPWLFRRAAAAAGGLAILMGGMSSGAPVADAQTASAPPPISITVHITDKGFVEKSVTVGTHSPFPTDGTVIFVNQGSMVHTATAVPGSNGAGVIFQQAIDAGGNVVRCFQGTGGTPKTSNANQLTRCGNGYSNLDTGGIDPGGQVWLACQSCRPGSAGGFGPDYFVTSATDCLNGNATPGFDCTPIKITFAGLGPQSSLNFWPGSVFDDPNSGNCVPSGTAADQNTSMVLTALTGTPTCASAVRKFQTLLGSPTKPVDSVTINIDDIKGFQPTYVTIKMGGSVTWKNTGTRIHSVVPIVPNLWHDPLMTGGGQGIALAPGESWSTTMPCSPGWNGHCATSALYYGSNIPQDLIRPQFSGFFGASAGVCPAGNDRCGAMAMTGYVTVACPGGNTELIGGVKQTYCDNQLS